MWGIKGSRFFDILILYQFAEHEIFPNVELLYYNVMYIILLLYYNVTYPFEQFFGGIRDSRFFDIRSNINSVSICVPQVLI